MRCRLSSTEQSFKKSKKARLTANAVSPGKKSQTQYSITQTKYYSKRLKTNVSPP